jgi:hypothetical protein
MSRAHRIRPLLPASLLMLVLFGSVFAGFGEKAEKDRKKLMSSFAKLKPGMTPEQVRQTVGAPKHISRQILYHRYREQWTFDPPLSVRLTFDCPRGEMPQLLPLPRVPIETDQQGGEARDR